MALESATANEPALLGCIADDVTGATDLAINLVQGGMRVIQWLDVPSLNDLRTLDADAIVIAMKTRSLPAQRAVAKSLEALAALQTIGCRRFFFKYCSTFDSTERGNIGPVTEALMETLGAEQTILCPAFPRNGRTVYRGHLFVGDRLLNESGMQNHPLNPMHDADLVRFLGKQSTKTVGLLSYDDICQDTAETVARLQDLQRSGVQLVITDCCNDAHLQTIAMAVADRTLVTGGSGIARYLPEAYRQQRLLAGFSRDPGPPDVRGRSLILSGSCSPATNGQVAHMKARCSSWRIDVPAILNDRLGELAKITAWSRTADVSTPLLVYSTAPPHVVEALQRKLGRETVAQAIEQFHATVAQMMVEQMDVRRLILAGGETAGAVVKALGIRALRIGPEICAGVPWTETVDEPRLALALKSGNFGAEDFFETALEMLA